MSLLIISLIPRYDQIHYLSSRSCEIWFYIEINKMAYPHVNVLSPDAGDLFSPFEVSMIRKV